MLFFQLLAHLLVLPILFIAVKSPNLVYQHWEGKKTAMAEPELQIRWEGGKREWGGGGGGGGGHPDPEIAGGGLSVLSLV